MERQHSILKMRQQLQQVEELLQQANQGRPYVTASCDWRKRWRHANATRRSTKEKTGCGSSLEPQPVVILNVSNA
jgi:hypothetical protein